MIAFGTAALFPPSLLRMRRTYVFLFSARLCFCSLAGVLEEAHLSVIYILAADGPSSPLPSASRALPKTSGAGAAEGQLVIGNGPWLVFRARPLACRLIGTTSIRSTRPPPLIDGGWRQESSFLTAQLRSQFAASLSQVVQLCMCAFILDCSLHFIKKKNIDQKEFNIFFLHK